MKIYFEDGELRNLTQLPEKPEFTIDAGKGITNAIKELDLFSEINPACIIYTNSIAAFSNRYAWNDKLQVPEIYIRAGEDMLFTRIDNLTGRILREGLNLAHLYLGGEFQEMYKNRGIEKE